MRACKTPERPTMLFAGFDAGLAPKYAFDARRCSVAANRALAAGPFGWKTGIVLLAFGACRQRASLALGTFPPRHAATMRPMGYAADEPLKPASCRVLAQQCPAPELTLGRVWPRPTRAFAETGPHLSPLLAPVRCNTDPSSLSARQSRAGSSPACSQWPLHRSLQSSARRSLRPNRLSFSPRRRRLSSSISRRCLANFLPCTRSRVTTTGPTASSRPQLGPALRDSLRSSASHLRGITG